MTLDEILALLPDNSSGDISAADLRTVVTELWTVANTQALIFVYKYATSTAPASGKVNIDWTTAATTLSIAKAADDGAVLPIGLIDSTTDNKFILATGDRSVKVTGTITGVSTDQGTYCTFPVSVSEAIGAQPSANTALNFTVFVYSEPT